MAKLGFLVTAFLFLGSFAQASELYTTCTSDGGYTECDVGVAIYNARVSKQLSREKSDGSGACVFGSQWGTVGTKFWTNYGCSAEFAFTTTNTPKPTPTPEPSPIPRPREPRLDLSCEWNGQNWQPYTHDFMHFIGMRAYGFVYYSDCSYTIHRARRNAVCNWDGFGFKPYDVRSNRIVGYGARTVDGCYRSIR